MDGTTNCQWCNLPVEGRQADWDGNHRDQFACRHALMRQLAMVTDELVKEVQKGAALKAKCVALEKELVEERVLVAHLAERLEICRSCPRERSTLEGDDEHAHP